MCSSDLTALQVGWPDLVDELLAGLGAMHPLVFGQVLRAIRDRPDACEASILARLNAGTRGADLVFYIRAGEAVRTVAAFNAICRLSDHPGWEVRAAVARGALPDTHDPGTSVPPDSSAADARRRGR